MSVHWGSVHKGKPDTYSRDTDWSVPGNLARIEGERRQVVREIRRAEMWRACGQVASGLAILAGVGLVAYMFWTQAAN